MTMKLSSSGDGYFIPDAEFDSNINIDTSKSETKSVNLEKLDSKPKKLNESGTQKKPKADSPLTDSDSDSDYVIYPNSATNSPNYVNRIIYKMDVFGAVKDESKNLLHLK